MAGRVRSSSRHAAGRWAGRLDDDQSNWSCFLDLTSLLLETQQVSMGPFDAFGLAIFRRSSGWPLALEMIQELRRLADDWPLRNMSVLWDLESTGKLSTTLFWKSAWFIPRVSRWIWHCLVNWPMRPFRQKSHQGLTQVSSGSTSKLFARCKDCLFIAAAPAEWPVTEVAKRMTSPTIPGLPVWLYFIYQNLRLWGIRGRFCLPSVLIISILGTCQQACFLIQL